MKLLDFAATEAFRAKVAPLVSVPRVQQQVLPNVDVLISRKNLASYAESVLSQPTLYEQALRVTGMSGAALARVQNPEALEEIARRAKATKCFMNVHTALRPLAQFCAALNERIALPCYAHAYASPANSQVFTPHWDSSSLLFVSMRGRITWRVWEPVIPSTDELGKPRAISPTLQKRPPLLETTLSQGDAMFVSAGWPHSGYTTAGRETLFVVIEVRHLNFGLTALSACC